MRPIYKSLALAAMTLQVSLALNAETRDDESASTMALQAELLDSLRVELVAQNVSGARDLIKSGECVIDGSNLTITLNAANWIKGATYRVQVLATFGTQTQVIYALNVTVPYYIALSAGPQEFEDNVTIVSTITDVTEADLEGLALEETSQEIKAAITPISAAAEAYNVGKMQLAAAITSKGVETSPTESYPEMAEKVNAISQETYEINGGEMYAKQLFGSLTTPKYWNLYEVLANLLSDGRLVSYGGILLAEYYRGYDSIALSGAGAGGAYVVSDKDSNGNFIMYTEDTTHTWAKEEDGKGNRWVAYCFADAGHDFDITDTNISPRSIHIGRSVGTIRSLVNGRVGDIVVQDGNSLVNFNTGTFTQNWGREVVLRNLQSITSTVLYLKENTEKVYIGASSISNTDVMYYINNDNYQMLNSIILHGANCSSVGLIGPKNIPNLKTIYIDECNGDIHIGSKAGHVSPNCNISLLSVTNCEELQIQGREYATTAIIKHIFIGYTQTTDKTKYITLVNEQGNTDYLNPFVHTEIVELSEGFCKCINIQRACNLTEESIYDYILQRLKQDEPDCGDGVTITLGSTNLAKLTSEESVQLLDDLTNIYGYTFA